MKTRNGIPVKGTNGIPNDNRIQKETPPAKPKQKAKLKQTAHKRRGER